MLGVPCAHRGGSIDEHPSQRAGAGRLRDEHGAGERAGAGAGIDDDERVGLAEISPPLVDGAGEDGAEERPDLR